MYSNSRMLEGVMNYQIVHLFPIPRVVRIVELVFLSFLFFLAFTTRMCKRVLLISVGTVMYILLAICNLFFSGNLSIDGVQDIYIRAAPFLLFTIIVQGQVANRNEIIFIVKFFSIVLLLNILVFLFLQLPKGFHEDHYAGLFEDAHLFCNVLLIFSATLFYDYLKSRKKIFLALSFTLLFVSFFPSNEKVIALTLLFFLLLYMKNLLARQNILGKIGIILCIFLISFGAFKYIENKDGGELWVRAQAMYDMFGIENIGPVIAWPMAFHEIQESSYSFLFGLGAGEYGWIAASRNVMEGKGSVHSKLFELEFSLDNINNAGYLFRTNTWSSLLAEYGILGFLVFIGVFFLIIQGVWQFETQDRLERNLQFAFYFILIIVIYQGFFTPYSNWSVSVLMFPAMYLAAFFVKRNSQYPSEFSYNE